MNLASHTFAALYNFVELDLQNPEGYSQSFDKSVVVSLDQFKTDVNANTAIAESKYKDKSIVITTKISGVKKDPITSKFYVEEYSNDPFNFAPIKINLVGELEFLQRLEEGSEETFVCKNYDSLLRISLNLCNPISRAALVEAFFTEREVLKGIVDKHDKRSLSYGVVCELPTTLKGRGF